MLYVLQVFMVNGIKLSHAIRAVFKWTQRQDISWEGGQEINGGDVRGSREGKTGALSVKTLRTSPELVFLPGRGADGTAVWSERDPGSGTTDHRSLLNQFTVNHTRRLFLLSPAGGSVTPFHSVSCSVGDCTGDVSAKS